MKKTYKTITTDEAAVRLKEGFDCVDAFRAEGLEATLIVQDAKFSRKEREAKRLSLKYGSESPQAIKATAKIGYAKEARVGIAEQAQRASIKVPAFEADTWRVQGRVVDVSFKAQPDLTVSLFNDDGIWITELGQACTDDKGFYAITFNEKDTGIGADRFKGQPLTLTVSDKNKTVLHQEEEPVYLEIGNLESRLIILGGEKCESPPNTVDNGGGTGTGSGGTVIVKPGEVTNPPTTVADAWIVRGKITSERTGEALVGITAELFDREGVFVSTLGYAKTNEFGKFSLSYKQAEFKELFDKNPNLYLRLLDEAGNTIYTSKEAVNSKLGEDVFKIKVSDLG